ncbi:MAG: OsmC family protein, partial [Chitinophagales bacterium]
MEVKLRRIDENYLMEAINESGNTVHTDGSPTIGGSNQAMRPMQLLLAGIGSCSSIDIISLLRKQRQELEDIQITV